MHIEGDAIIFDKADVQGFLFGFYTDIAGFLGSDPKPTHLVIPLEGAKVLGLTITVKESDDEQTD